jgi:hypothetical protein
MKRSRWFAFALAVGLVASACSSTPETIPSTSDGPATTVPGPTSSAPAPAPTGDDLAAGAFTPIPGYEYTAANEDRLRTVLEGIVSLLPAFAGSATTALHNDDGEVAAVLSLVPIVDARGDPALLPALVDQLATVLDATPTERELDSVSYREIGTGAETWFLWGNHTRILVAVSDDAEAGAKAFARLALANSIEHLWMEGDCLDFAPRRSDLPYAPFGDSEIVGCDERHTHDVLFTTTVSEPAGAPFPDDLSDRVKHTCEGAFLDATGVPYWQATPTMTLYLPDEAEWTAGDRYLSCVISLEGPGGEPADRSGEIVDLGEALRFDVTAAACWGESFKPITTNDCDLPHVHESVGTITHPAPAGDPYPGSDELDSFRRDECDALVGAVTTPPPTGHGIVSIPYSIGKAEWEDGARSMLCVAAVQDVFGAATRVSGSLTGEWKVVGPGDSITA